LEERHRGERSAMARLEQQFGETSARRDAIAPEIERLGTERSACWPTISSSTASRSNSPARPSPWKRV